MYSMPSEKEIEARKQEYLPGTKIRLIHMDDDIHPIPPNTIGTVMFVDDIGTIHCNFDNHCRMGVCPEADTFEKL